MSSTRRTFLKRLGAAGVVSIGAAPPMFLARAACAAKNEESKPTSGRILVLIQLAGGNDGLNTVIPHGDAEYQKARPGIGIAQPSVLRIDDYHGLHPAMSGFKQLYDDGALAVVGADGRQLASVSYGPFCPAELYHPGSIEARARAMLQHWAGAAVFHSHAAPCLSVLLFSWGDLTRELLLTA